MHQFVLSHLYGSHRFQKMKSYWKNSHHNRSWSWLVQMLGHVPCHVRQSDCLLKVTCLRWDISFPSVLYSIHSSLHRVDYYAVLGRQAAFVAQDKPSLLDPSLPRVVDAWWPLGVVGAGDEEWASHFVLVWQCSDLSWWWNLFVL